MDGIRQGDGWDGTWIQMGHGKAMNDCKGYDRDKDWAWPGY